MVGNMKFVRLLAFILALACICSTFFSLPASAAAVEVFENETSPVNPNANQTCKNFYQYLWNVRKSGEMISGAVSNKVIGINGTKADAENDYHQYINDLYGVTPVIMGNVLEDHTGFTDNDIKVLAERYEQGAIPMFQFGPGDGSYVPESKNGIVHFDKTNPDRIPEAYDSFVKELKEIGEFCKRLEDAGIEVYIIRLWIECNNSSKHGFYGVDQTGYDSFKRCWKDVVDYLTTEAGLTGILFAYAPAGYDTSDRYYPGSDRVDINCPTVYANTSDGEIFKTRCAEDYEWMRYENRPLGFSELAARAVLEPASTRPIGDYADTLDTLMHAFPELSFFVLWYENGFSIEPSNGTASLGNYNGEYFIKHPKVIVAENALDYRSSKEIKSNGIATFYKNKSKSQSVCLNLGNYTEKDLKAKGINLSDIVSLDVLFGCAVSVYQTSDCSGEATVYTGDAENINVIFKNAKSLSIIKLENVALEKGIWTDNEDNLAFKLNDGKNDRYVTEAKNDDGTMDITIDLGSEYVIGQASLNLAGFFEENIYNARDFALYVSNDDFEYKMVYKTIANTATAANMCFDAVNARYVKLHIITPNNSTSSVENKRVSIAEILVYGTDKVKIAEVATNVDNQKPDNNKQELIDNNLISNNNQQLVGDLSNNYGDSMTDNNENANAITNDGDDEKTPILPQYKIPQFNNYVWIIYCGALLILICAFWSIILLSSKKKKGVKFK